ncbi:Glycosyl transferase family 2 [Sulfitobacter marinus]|uniref:Glycosyl transferase family 2 n=1 Tax=Sulfitobacter marinus TaxID=394264 RepID=A0A1I6T9P7_9RHOB|nr:glycosyltransferase [Sulfitobacter marinus]SFS85941.1 Glycosyl transferase family 2 [Sulfitobacter marinus]
MESPHIHILLCTKNGGPYIQAQLESILAQTHQDWTLWISDDRSDDDTLVHVGGFAADHPDRDIQLVTGPGQGCARNFMSLLSRPELTRAWVAFADQDDVWMPDKLARAVNMIWRGTGAQIYACRSIFTDAALNPIGISPDYQRPFGFGNALVQNILRGNTIVMPPDVTELLTSTLPLVLNEGVPFHDWWVYQTVTGAGFDVIHDARPGLLYRQHDNNLLGSNRSHAGQRAAIVLRRVFAEWVDRNVRALSDLSPILTRQNRRVLFDFIDWRAQPASDGRVVPKSIGVYRQSLGGDLALRALARLGKL